MQKVVAFTRWIFWATPEGQAIQNKQNLQTTQCFVETVCVKAICAGWQVNQASQSFPRMLEFYLPSTHQNERRHKIRLLCLSSMEGSPLLVYASLYQFTVCTLTQCVAVFCVGKGCTQHSWLSLLSLLLPAMYLFAAHREAGCSKCCLQRYRARKTAEALLLTLSDWKLTYA